MTVISGRGGVMMSYGGHLADIPLPHRRCFPGEWPRLVKVELTSWIGYSAGAKHWYADIEEEDNYLWDSAEKCWRIAWDDAKGKGRRERVEFAGPDGRDRALKWIRSVVRKRYSDRKLWKIERHYMAPAERPMPWEGD